MPFQCTALAGVNIARGLLWTACASSIRLSLMEAAKLLCCPGPVVRCLIKLTDGGPCDSDRIAPADKLLEVDAVAAVRILARVLYAQSAAMLRRRLAEACAIQLLADLSLAHALEMIALELHNGEAWPADVSREEFHYILLQFVACLLHHRSGVVRPPWPLSCMQDRSCSRAGRSARPQIPEITCYMWSLITSASRSSSAASRNILWPA